MKLIYAILICLVILFIFGCNKKVICGNGIIEAGEDMVTCCEDVGCFGEQKCVSNKCVEPICGECQYLQNSMCLSYECCKSIDCQQEKVCIKHKCIKKEDVPAGSVGECIETEIFPGYVTCIMSEPP